MASLLYVLVQTLVRRCLGVSDLDSGISRELKKAITEKIMKRFSIDKEGYPLDSVLDSPLIKAAVLDPRYKQQVLEAIAKRTCP